MVLTRREIKMNKSTDIEFCSPTFNKITFPGRSQDFLMRGAMERVMVRSTVLSDIMTLDVFLFPSTVEPL